ncbi:MAG: hypothetical protein EOO11_22505, partial [Chitinophagaceae bacterium]
MNAFTKTLTGAALAAVVALSACKKKEDTSLSYEQQNRRAWLTDTTWFFYWAALDINRDGTPDQYLQPNTFADCYWDNTYTFFPNGAGITNDSSYRCDTTVPVLKPFTWAFSDNDQYLNVTGTSVFGISGHLRVYFVGGDYLT